MMKQTGACLIKTAGRDGRKRPGAGAGAGRELSKAYLLFSAEKYSVLQFLIRRNTDTHLFWLQIKP